MPKVGMEPLRRKALIDATILAIGERGTLDVTMSEIAGRAGVSSALAHHYFGAKEDLLQATMRHLLSELNADGRAALRASATPRAARFGRHRGQLLRTSSSRPRPSPPGSPSMSRRRSRLRCAACSGSMRDACTPI